MEHRAPVQCRSTVGNGRHSCSISEITSSASQIFPPHGNFPFLGHQLARPLYSGRANPLTSHFCVRCLYKTKRPPPYNTKKRPGLGPGLSDRSLFSIIKRRRCGHQNATCCIGGVEILLGSALGSTWFHLVPCCSACIIYSTLAWFLLGSTWFQVREV